MYKNVTIYRHASEQATQSVNLVALEVYEVVNCFKRGLEKHGIKANIKSLDDEPFEKSDLAIFWGAPKKCTSRGRQVKKLQDFLKSNNNDFISLERGYVKRLQDFKQTITAIPTVPRSNCYYSAGFNGLNGHADFKNQNMPSDRWEKLDVELKPWRKGGENILLCGQVPWDAAVINVVPNYEESLDRTSEKIAELTNREIIFRPHPYIIDYNPTLMFSPTLDFKDTRWWHENGVHVPSQASSISTERKKSLLEELENAWVSVSLNSNSGVESIINGVPTIAYGPGSMAKEVATELENIEKPNMPDREQWAWNLAYAQWQMNELESGLTWEHLCHQALT